MTYRRAQGGTASAITWVKHTKFDVPEVRRTAAKAIMLALTDYVDCEWMARVGQKRIAAEADVSERTVRRFFAGAEAAGFLCRAVVQLGVGNGRGRAVDAVYLHVNGETESCPCGHDQPANLTAEPHDDQPAKNVRPTGQCRSTNRPVPVNAPYIRTQEREPNEPSAQPPVQQALVSHASDVQFVFDAWREATGRQRSNLDTTRRRLITNALKNYPRDDVVDAVRGWRHSPFHCGRNADATVYDGLNLLLRNAEQIEKFRDLERNPPTSRRPTSGNGRGAALRVALEEEMAK